MFEHNYSLTFILKAQEADLESIGNALKEIGEDIEVAVDDAKNEPNMFKVRLRTQDPALVFDVCGQFGRITSAKVDEIQ